MLPVISSCPDCGSNEVVVLSRMPLLGKATHEMFCQCDTCGADWWEEDQQESRHRPFDSIAGFDVDGTLRWYHRPAEEGA